MNVYELFGLVLVIAMVAMLLVAARSLGEHERKVDPAKEPAGRPARKVEERENSGA